jgi:uncharacterized protein
MGRVIHFEITADDPERAAEFYAKVFGWDIKNWGGPEPYWLASTGDASRPGIDGAIMHRQESRQAVIDTVDVESWEKAAEAIRSAGGKVVTGKNEIPGVGFFGYAEDTEGNLFGFMESAPAPPR